MHGHGQQLPSHRHDATGRTLAFALVEVFAARRAGSLALLADAGHMETDAAALGLSACAAWLSARPPDLRHTYGFAKAEMLAVLANACAMLAVVQGIAIEAWKRLLAPGAVDGAAVGTVALLGLFVNLLVAWRLSRGQPNLNVRAALLHVMGDVLGSVAALAAGVIIWLAGWTPIGPIMSIFMVASSLGLFLEALRGALDAVPAPIDLAELGMRLASAPGVREIHDLHFWSISPERPALSAHVRVSDLVGWPRALSALAAIARDACIHHVAFQPTAAAGSEQPVRFHLSQPRQEDR